MGQDQSLIPDLVRLAVERLLRGEYNAARSALASVDYEGLVSERRAALRSRRAKLARAIVWAHNPPRDADSYSPVAGRLGRKPVPDYAILATFERDHFICRYSHCSKRTIHIPVLRALSALFPDIIPYNRNWRPLKDLILYWTYSTSLEHRISFPHGGTSDLENLITACYQCNDIKNMAHAGDLGWEVAEIQEADWDGLSGCLPALRDVKNPRDRYAH